MRQRVMIAMAVVENVCDRVGVMSLGQIVETGTRARSSATSTPIHDG